MLILGLTELKREEVFDARHASQSVGRSFLVDVRESSEWRAGHALGAVHVPLGDLQGQGLRALELKGVKAGTGDIVLLICHSGMRSGLACQTLAGDAPFKAINVRGGMIAWQRSGLPMAGAR